MGRGKLAMELIKKEKSRKTTFLKRKKGLLKKAYELSTLCGIDMCLIIYGGNLEGEEQSEVETWPEDPKQVKRIINKYWENTKDKLPRKNYDLYEFFNDRKSKVDNAASRLRTEMFRALYPTWDVRFNHLGRDELRMLASILDTKLEACSTRLKSLKGKQYVMGKGGVDSSASGLAQVQPYSQPMFGSHSNDALISTPQGQPSSTTPLMQFGNQLPLLQYPQLEQGTSQMLPSLDSSAMQSHTMMALKNPVHCNWPSEVGLPIMPTNAFYDPFSLNVINGAVTSAVLGPKVEKLENIIPVFNNQNTPISSYGHNQSSPVQSLQPILIPPCEDHLRSSNTHEHLYLPQSVINYQDFNVLPTQLHGIQVNDWNDYYDLQAPMFSYHNVNAKHYSNA